MSRSMLALAAFSAVAAAQPPLNDTLDTAVPYLWHCGGTMMLGGTMPAASRERLPAIAGKPRTVATAKLAYVVWRTDPGNDTLHFARTTDSGYTWSRRVAYRAPGGETINNFQIAAEGHTVYIGWVSNVAGHQAPWNVWVIGSQDQGLTWSAPVLANPITAAKGDANHYPALMQMVASRDITTNRVRAYFVYEYGDNRSSHPRYQGKEAPYFTALEMVAGKPATVLPERDVSTVPVGKNPDIDNVAIHVRGPFVLVCYRNDRNTYAGAGTSFNQVFGNLSTDGGRTWQARDFLLGTGADPQINGTAGASNADCLGDNMAIDGASLYYIWKDRSHNVTAPPAVRANERLILAASHDLGRTWSQKVVTTFRAGLADVDERVIHAENGRVLIAVTSDERGRHKSIAGMNGTLTNTPADRSVPGDNQGDGNYSDGVQVFLSTDRGKTFTDQWLSRPSIDNGTVQATQSVPNVGPSQFKQKGTNLIYCKNLQMAARGDVVHLAWEEHWYSYIYRTATSRTFQGEDLVMRQSHDGGKTWSPPVNVTRGAGEVRGFQLNNGTNADIDSPWMRINGNGQAIVGYRWQDPHGSTTSRDKPHVAVRSNLEIESVFTKAAALEIRNIPASQAGAVAFVIGTLDPNPTPWRFPVFGDLGFEPNIVPDLATQAFLGLFQFYSGVIPPGGGTVKFPAVPDMGGTIPVVGLTYDARTGRFLSFSARNRY